MAKIILHILLDHRLTWVLLAAALVAALVLLEGGHAAHAAVRWRRGEAAGGHLPIHGALGQASGLRSEPVIRFRIEALLVAHIITFFLLQATSTFQRLLDMMTFISTHERR